MIYKGQERTGLKLLRFFINVLFKKPKIQSFSPREKKIFKEKMNLPWVLPERG
jgi:hypothetical protein